MELVTIITLIVVSILGLYFLWETYELSKDNEEQFDRLIDIDAALHRLGQEPKDILVPSEFLLTLYRNKIITQFEFRLYLEQYYGFDIDAAIIPEVPNDPGEPTTRNLLAQWEQEILNEDSSDDQKGTD